MPRPLCQEDLYDYHIKKIFRRLRQDYADRLGDQSKTFEEWIESKTAAQIIADRFIEDVVEWSGIPEEED